jgi:hypothetical protein
MVRNSDSRSSSNPFVQNRKENPFIQMNLSGGIRLFGGGQLAG